MSGNIIKIKLLFLVLISQLTFSELILAARGDVFYITGSLVNIREKSTTESKVVALISKGRQVEEITRQAGWVKVKILGTNKQGWIHTALLSYRKPVMSPAEEELISHAPVSAKKKENVQDKATQIVEDIILDEINGAGVGPGQPAGLEEHLP